MTNTIRKSVVDIKLYEETATPKLFLAGEVAVCIGKKIIKENVVHGTWKKMKEQSQEKS